MTAPTAEHQITFLSNVQRLLSEGAFTSTYKYALLLALADMAVELGDDSGAPLTVPTRLIAGKFIEYYWPHVAPYTATAVVLRQNTDRQAAVVQKVARARRLHGDSLAEVRRQPRHWNALVRSVQTTVCKMPLWKLQRVGDEVLDFLYEQGEDGDQVILRPGAAFCLRHFHALITDLVRGAWLEYIRRVNAGALGDSVDLADFLFGSDRADVGPLRPVLIDLQHGRCFYCARDLRGGIGHLDHFVPWARYPADLAHNFVVAHDRCNADKGKMLAVEEHLGRWAERNKLYADQLGAVVTVRADLGATLQIARWAYGEACAAGAQGWVLAKDYRKIGPGWAACLG